MARISQTVFRGGAVFLVASLMMAAAKADGPRAAKTAADEPPPELVEPRIEDHADDTKAKAVPGPIEAELAAAMRKPDLVFKKVFEFKADAAPKQKAVAIAVSGDGSRAVTCTARGECQSWDVTAGKPLATYGGVKTDKDSPFAMAITQDGRLALVGGASGGLHVWDAQSGKHVFTYKKPARITHLDLTPDGKYMAAVDIDGKLFTYPVTGGQGWTIAPERGRPCTFLALHPKWETALVGPWSDSSLLISALGATIEGNRTGEIDLKHDGEILPVVSADLCEHCAVFGTSRGEVVVCPGPITPKGGFTTVFYKSRVEDPRLVHLTGNTETLVAMDDSGRIEYRWLRYPNMLVLCRITCAPIVAMGVSQDGKTVAYGHEDGLSVWRLPELPRRSPTRLVALMDDLSVRGEYDKLEVIATLLQRETRPFPWSADWSRFETMIHWMSDGRAAPFWRGGGADERTRKWRTARPDSVAAKLVEAQRLIDEAWKARGSGFAFTVTKEGWKVFRAKIEEARQLVQPIADSEKPPAEVFTPLFAIAMAQSWERDQVDKYVEKLMKAGQRHDSAHVQVAQLLMPRWGGEQGDSVAYAAKIADRLGGAQGDAVYARAAMALRKYHRFDTFLEETGFDPERVHKGIARLIEEVPDDLSLVHEGLMFAFMDKDKEKGKVYARKLFVYDDDWSIGGWPSQAFYLGVRNWAVRE